MLFHSFEFLFGFLPLCFLLFVAIVHWRGWQAGIAFLGAASLFFYGQWSVPLALLLSLSIVANYGFATAIDKTRSNRRANGWLFFAAVLGNLGALGYFKYANFFLDNIDLIAGTSFPALEILLPVGISFYTFIQIGYLVELYTGQARLVNFRHYFLFASFFPCVTAGPIILQKEMMPQFERQASNLIDKLRIATALTIIAIGLFKKLVLADSIAPFADDVFNGVAGGASVDVLTAWVGALAYTLQLYFDFSGYSDMALGIGYLFGFRLPLNFNSPLKASSIIDFWRRWHMTMTRFFTNYLYTPVGVSLMRRAIKGRFSKWKRFGVAIAIPVVWTFVLAGLWHGAGWTFVVFGLLHGFALAGNHAWREAGMGALPWKLGWMLTMAVVVTGLVLFRSADLPTALTILASMGGLATLEPSSQIIVDLALAGVLIFILGIIALACPNTQELLRDHPFSTDAQDGTTATVQRWLTWRPSPRWAVGMVLVIVAALGFISGETSFVYYQF